MQGYWKNIFIGGVCMSNKVLMSNDEKCRLLDIARKLKDEGNEEEYEKIRKQIPLAPHLAMAMKEVFGSEYARNSGFNFSDAEIKYGKDWLDK